MEKYKITNSQVSVVGDNNQLNNISLTVNNMHSYEMDIQKLQEEIKSIVDFLVKKEIKSTEEKILVSDMYDLLNLSGEGTIKEITNDLKNKASKLLYDIATGVNAGLIVNILSKVLGM
ncbi:hypothetical protein AJ85_06435 [Alkalihalobacillus alcalophilus ATCC 27647 = CGMCC 1.3604]|uniref:Uncharacterized protein n=1 Tax=Alkalihalobacillus alcalophilus ATCC 27647 = CGMCC 1.3604 TaxID=1218173 RepID=A0A094WP94_ALKAL|nr:hypothetical protein [Alkalihalobacillus alcalophilus]KGA98651.1 hypothetical protein BALCAV_0203255 [Alkalihalobacillus alcalophilus ATCC 27647 = CGMCC 1.3604]MED1562428.1 hypothetical protein [Alkalihalobacillus alcalophilus]THG91164.1 hypothetical protein AJ85_06435 [Alkalihalobacillus alcalophilus ATCC 27647 = CGMCC 1.3604]